MSNTKPCSQVPHWHQSWFLGLKGGEAQILLHLPYKLVAHWAEGGLWEEGGCELVTLDIVDFGLFDGSPALVQGEEAFSLTVSQVLCIWGERKNI